VVFTRLISPEVSVIGPGGVVQVVLLIAVSFFRKAMKQPVLVRWVPTANVVAMLTGASAGRKSQAPWVVDTE
jgi:hypothetical protein